MSAPNSNSPLGHILDKICQTASLANEGLVRFETLYLKVKHVFLQSRAM